MAAWTCCFKEDQRLSVLSVLSAPERQRRCPLQSWTKMLEARAEAVALHKMSEEFAHFKIMPDLDDPAKRSMAVSFALLDTGDAGVVCAACFASLCTKEHTQCSRCTACHYCNKKIPKGALEWWAQCKTHSTFQHSSSQLFFL